MITEIGIVAGKILELLEERNGVLVFGEIHSDLNQPRDLVLMGLGWLLHEGYLQIMESPSTASYLDEGRNRSTVINAGVFDLVVESRNIPPASKRIKNMSSHIGSVADRVLILLEGCGGLLDLQTVERNLNEHRDIVLMGLGWLIREGYVRGVATAHETLLFRLSAAEMADQQMMSLTHV